MNESNHNINFIYGFFHKFQLAFWTHINWYPEQTLFLNNLTVTWIVHDPQHCESKNKRYQCTFLYSVWCLSHKEFSRYHHNQADDNCLYFDICTNNRKINKPFLFTKGSWKYASCSVSNGYKLFLNCEEID